jgi:tRNA threonylcarbamoyladenosine biosynthesis protein TsaE
LKRLELDSADAAATRAVGRCLARGLGAGTRIGLSGELGAGKTTLVRGIAEGLGIAPEEVRSPSFPIVIPHLGGRLPLYHIDLFRWPAGDIDSLALREYIYGPGVCAIEWHERLDEPMEDYLEITLHFAAAGRRRLVAVAHGRDHGAAIAALRAGGRRGDRWIGRRAGRERQ